MQTDAAHVLEVSSALTASGHALSGAVSMSQAHPGSQLTALLDAVRALDAAGVRAVLIGGPAVGVRSAIPRATMDVDLAAVSTLDRDRVVTALERAGFGHRGSFAHSENFRHHSGEPVQVAFHPAMDDAIGRAEQVAIAGRYLFVVRTDDLVAMKHRAGNAPGRRRSKALRDLADVELLSESAHDTEEGW